jgi:hypothetical protein
MHALKVEMERFLAERTGAVEEARQRAALQLACGIDMETLRDLSPEAAARVAARLDRVIERERQKGLRRHWSYDLNRHIALKQARDGLLARMRPSAQAQREDASAETNTAPRRRRRTS